MSYMKTQKGFSIVELMVALVLGLFLVSGVTAMYISSKQSYRMTDNLSRLQESLRFSLEFISRDVRMAGYMPCRYPPLANNVMNDPVTGDATTGADAWFLDFFNFGIRGYEGGVDTFPTDLPATGLTEGDRVSGADAIVILKSGVYASSLEFHNVSGNALTLQNGFDDKDFKIGEIGIACDPRQASIFQISNVDETNRILSYTNTNIVPGNANTNIGSFGEDAQIAPYEPVVYFIANSTQNANVKSLKRKYLAARASGPNEIVEMREEELLEGVETMQILYGVDTTVPNDQIVDRYVTANNVTDWLNVISVRLGLLMSTGEEVTTDLDTNTYNIAGTLISNTSVPAAHGGDRKLRYVSNTTINLRNRVEN